MTAMDDDLMVSLNIELSPVNQTSGFPSIDMNVTQSGKSGQPPNNHWIFVVAICGIAMVAIVSMRFVTTVILGRNQSVDGDNIEDDTPTVCSVESC